VYHAGMKQMALGSEMGMASAGLFAQIRTSSSLDHPGCVEGMSPLRTLPLVDCPETTGRATRG